MKQDYTYGASQESLWPYIIGKFRMQPSKPALTDAEVTQNFNYYKSRFGL
jgi:hypothetical protein